MKEIKVIYLCAKDHRLKSLESCKVFYNDIKAYVKPLDYECDCLDELQYGHRDDNYVVDFVFNRWLEKMCEELRYE